MWQNMVREIEEIQAIKPHESEYYCSKGLQKLHKVNGFSTLVDYMKALVDLPIVSVGSGSGYVEKQCMEKIKNLNMILVDPLKPDENEFYPVPSHLSQDPSYNYTNDLITAKPEIVDNCHLFLNWPLPDPNEDVYDYDAILLLKPKKIIICCEVSGSSGSQKLLAWLRYCGLKCMDEVTILPNQYKINNPKYEIDKYISTDSYCLMGFPTRIVLIQLSKV